MQYDHEIASRAAVLILSGRALTLRYALAYTAALNCPDHYMRPVWYRQAINRGRYVTRYQRDHRGE